jgi:hypothetical protein
MVLICRFLRQERPWTWRWDEVMPALSVRFTYFRLSSKMHGKVGLHWPSPYLSTSFKSFDQSRCPYQHHPSLSAMLHQAYNNLEGEKTLYWPFQSFVHSLRGGVVASSSRMLCRTCNRSGTAVVRQHSLQCGTNVQKIAAIRNIYQPLQRSAGHSSAGRRRLGRCRL